MLTAESASPQLYAGGLMFPDVIDSLNAMPPSLYAKLEKFYTAQPPRPVYLSRAQRAAVIADMLNWLDQTWLSGDLNQAITYDQYIQFRQTLLLLSDIINARAALRNLSCCRPDPMGA
jgi:hypothetical protein